MSGIGHNNGPMIRDAGWYATHRDMINHPVVGICKPVKPKDPSKPACSRFEAWHWLIAQAAWKAETYRNKGALQTIQPGQLVGGRDHLSKTWNWSEKTVRWFLKILLDEQMITLATDAIKGQQRANTANIITLCNYLKYQLTDDEVKTVEGPAKGHISNKDTINNRKKDDALSPSESAPTTQLGVSFVGGKLSVLNGTKAALEAEFPGIDLTAVCNAAAAPVAQLADRTPDAMLAMIRSMAQARLDKPKRPAAVVRGTRLPRDWVLPKAWGLWALEKKPGSTEAWVREQAEAFAHFWWAKAGVNSTKADWLLTWKTWINKADPPGTSHKKPRNSNEPVPFDYAADARLREAMRLEQSRRDEEARAQRERRNNPLPGDEKLAEEWL